MTRRDPIPTATQIADTERAAGTTVTPEAWARQSGLKRSWVRSVFETVRKGRVA